MDTATASAHSAPRGHTRTALAHLSARRARLVPTLLGRPRQAAPPAPLAGSCPAKGHRCVPCARQGSSETRPTLRIQTPQSAMTAPLVDSPLGTALMVVALRATQEGSSPPLAKLGATLATTASSLIPRQRARARRARGAGMKTLWGTLASCCARLARWGTCARRPTWSPPRSAPWALLSQAPGNRIAWTAQRGGMHPPEALARAPHVDWGCTKMLLGRVSVRAAPLACMQGHLGT